MQFLASTSGVGASGRLGGMDQVCPGLRFERGPSGRSFTSRTGNHSQRFRSCLQEPDGVCSSRCPVTVVAKWRQHQLNPGRWVPLKIHRLTLLP